MLAAQAHLVDVLPASEALGPGARPVPARRPAGQLGAGVRTAARGAGRRDALRGARRLPRGRRARARGRRRRGLGAVPRPRRRRADGRGGLPVDVDVLPARHRLRPRVLVLAERGARQGAPLRRLRARGGRAGCTG